MLIVDDKAVGMGALRKLEDGVGEIKHMRISNNLLFWLTPPRLSL